MSHPNATDAALYWGLIGVGVGLNSTDRDATATGAREALRKAVAFAIADPGAALDRYRAHGESMPDFQALAVMVALDLLSRSKAASFTPQQAPQVDVMNLAADYLTDREPAMVLHSLDTPRSTNKDFYDPAQMRAAFRHGWDARPAAPAPAQIYCCSGCGWIALDPAADLVQLRSFGDTRSCCPERDMQPMDPREIMGKLMALRRLRREADAASVRLTTDALAASVPTPEEINAALTRMGLSHLKSEPLNHREDGEFGEGATVRPRVSQATADAMMAVAAAAGKAVADPSPELVYHVAGLPFFVDDGQKFGTITIKRQDGELLGRIVVRPPTK